MKFFDNIGGELKKYGIVFAKINMDLNDTPRHGVYSVITGDTIFFVFVTEKGYPTIKYFNRKTRLSESFKEEKLLPGKLLEWIYLQSG